MTGPPPPKRTAVRHVERADLFDWLPTVARPGAAVAVVLPDAAEVGMSPAEWTDWFARAARECARYSDGPVVFYQTDRKQDGRWLAKDQYVTDAVLFMRHMLWHKVVLRRDPGKVDLHRPGYSHLLAFGPPGRPGKPTPDVIPAGPYLWRNGIGATAARFIASYLRDQGATALINPCCGRGTLLAAANEVGLDAYGCDVDEERVAYARDATLPKG